MDIWNVSLTTLWERLVTCTTHPRYDILDIQRFSEKDGKIQVLYVYKDRTEAFHWLRYMVSKETYDHLRTVDNMATFDSTCHHVMFHLFNAQYEIRCVVELLCMDTQTKTRVTIESIQMKGMLSRLPRFILNKVERYIESRIKNDAREMFQLIVETTQKNFSFSDENGDEV